MMSVESSVFYEEQCSHFETVFNGLACFSIVSGAPGGQQPTTSEEIQ